MKQLGLFGGEPPFDSEVLENAEELSKEAAQKQNEILEKTQNYKESSSRKKIKIKKPNKVSSKIAAEEKNLANSGIENLGKKLEKKAVTNSVENFAPKAKDSSLDVALSPVKRQAKPQKKALMVSEVNRHIKGLLEGEFPDIWIQGEISNFVAHGSGHYYFSLKDEKAQISAVMFKGFNSKLRFRPETGMEVIAKGKITVYEPRGGYQIFCQSMEPVGAGALQMAYDQLKKKLQAEGLFSPERKKTLPAWPKKIALVTSPTGAAVKDMLKVLKRRYKGLTITVIPTLVQGNGAPASIVKSLNAAQKIEGLDLILCGRGGGSIEDLWGFNSEDVARAIVASKVPIISAVGHEIDFTIADFVADLRAPTPSAAAELAVKNTDDILKDLGALKSRNIQSIVSKLQFLRQSVNVLESKLVDPQRRLQDLSMRCDELTERLSRATLNRISKKQQQAKLLEKSLVSPDVLLKQSQQQLGFLSLKMTEAIKTKIIMSKSQLSEAAKVLDSISPLKVLDRGYSMAQKNNKVIRSSSQIKKGDSMSIKFADGSADVTVDKVSKD